MSDKPINCLSNLFLKKSTDFKKDSICEHKSKSFEEGAKLLLISKSDISEPRTESPKLVNN